MPFDPTARVPLGPDRPQRHPARLRRRVDRRAVRGGHRRRRASRPSTRPGTWGSGSFDTAPLYGYGASERRIGAALARPAARRVRPVDEGRPARPAARRRSRPAPTSTARPSTAATTPSTSATGPVRIVFDYSADGVRRSIEESLERLGLDRIDIALIHDPDDHWQAAIDGAYPALAPAPRGGRDPGRSAPG